MNAVICISVLKSAAKIQPFFGLTMKKVWKNEVKQEAVNILINNKLTKTYIKVGVEKCIGVRQEMHIFVLFQSKNGQFLNKAKKNDSYAKTLLLQALNSGLFRTFAPLLCIRVCDY